MSEESTAVTLEPGLEKIFEQLDTLSLGDAAQLVKALEDRWGVSAAAPAAVALAAAPAAEEVEEQTEFDVVLKSAGPQKIQVIKVVREITSLGLKEAKALVDSAPQAVKEAAGKDEAAEIKAKIEAAGGEVELR